MDVLRSRLRRALGALAALVDRRRYRVLASVAGADEVPAALPRRGAVLVGEPTSPKWLVFDCPCREHHRVMLNLDVARSPRWFASGGDRLTISPSVDAPSARGRCHYFVREGRVKWAK